MSYHQDVYLSEPNPSNAHTGTFLTVSRLRLFSPHAIVGSPPDLSRIRVAGKNGEYSCLPSKCYESLLCNVTFSRWQSSRAAATHTVLPARTASQCWRLRMRPTRLQYTGRKTASPSSRGRHNSTRGLWTTRTSKSKP